MTDRLILLLVVASLCGCGDDTNKSPDAGTDAGPDATADANIDAGPDAGVNLPAELGSFAVGHTSFTATDDAREGRQLLVDMWFPVDEGAITDEEPAEYTLQGPLALESEVALEGPPISSAGRFPLLVFSHGFGGTNTQSTPLMETLASHGFIILSPEHTGNTALDGSDPNPDEKRVPDVSFLIDTMLARSADSGDTLFEKIDGDQIGVLGHSFGGTTSVGMLVGWAGAPADARVKAIVVIAGGVRTFEASALATIDEPVLMLAGTLDPNAIMNHNFGWDEMTSASALYKVEVTGANHTHFANICQIGNFLISIGIGKEMWPDIGAGALTEPYNDTCEGDVYPIEEAIRVQNLYTVAFFKRYLLGDTGYEPFLAPEYAEANEDAVEVLAR